jgi:hypothetical protein
MMDEIGAASPSLAVATYGIHMSRYETHVYTQHMRNAIYMIGKLVIGPPGFAPHYGYVVCMPFCYGFVNQYTRYIDPVRILQFRQVKAQLRPFFWGWKMIARKSIEMCARDVL